MRRLSSLRFRRSLLALPAVALLAMPLAAGAATTPACDKACDAFDAKYDGRSDDEAYKAVKALEKTCAGNDAAMARAISREAILWFGRKDLDESLRLFEESVRLNPESPSLRIGLCGVQTETKHYEDAISTCRTGLALATAKDDGSADKHEDVLKLGFNLALAKTRRGGGVCADPSIHDAFEAYRAAHPDHAWSYQLAGAWVWDCQNDFDKGFALYKKSCDMGWEAACEQVRYTEECRCKTHQGR
jgi:hypothetical protein